MNATATHMSMEPTVHLSVEQLEQEAQPAGLIPQHWCDGCARHTWVVTLEEAVEIASVSPSCYSAKAGKAITMRNVHAVTTSTGGALICLKSLFQCIFSICEATA